MVVDYREMRHESFVGRSSIIRLIEMVREKKNMKVCTEPIARNTMV